MSSRLERREFLKVASVSLAGGALVQDRAQGQASAPAALPIVISSANGMQATAKAMEILKGGGKPLDAVIAGVNIVEDDPNDNSVGYGGLPNEDCEVELDASVMGWFDLQVRGGRGPQVHQESVKGGAVGDGAHRPHFPRGRRSLELCAENGISEGEPPHRGLAQEMA